jgi:histidinol dehydrogenase
MAIRLDTRAADFAQRFHRFLDSKREVAADVEGSVREIVADVAARGDPALCDYTAKFDGFEATAAALRVSEQELTAAFSACERPLLEALEFARGRIEAFHRRHCIHQNR